VANSKGALNTETTTTTATSPGVESGAVPQIPSRIASIDALRGFDMFWITGGEGLVHSLYKALPGPTMAALDTQFHHVLWQGFVFYDLIFPLFVFVVGLVLPFSLTHRLEKGASRRQLYRHIVQRLFLLFFLGLIYNGLLDLNFHELRLAGVLQRIALCYFFAAIIVMNTNVRGQAIAAGGILIAYWMIMALIPVPGVGANVLTPQGNLSAYVDQHLLPRPFCCYTFGDNEGILSTLPAISTCLLGVLAGHWLRSRRSQSRKTLGLIIAGVSSLLVALAWNPVFPIIKNIWTSSYVLYAAGWSLLLLALFYWIIDVWGYKRWAFFFTVIGVNPITIYLIDRFFNFGLISNIFIHGFVNHLGAWQPFVSTVGSVAVGWLFLYYLYRRKIFLRV
jgi:predicted acyltransferase